MASIDENRDPLPNAAPNPPPFQFGLKDLFWLFFPVAIIVASGWLMGIGGAVLAFFIVSLASWIGARIRGKRRAGNFWGTITICEFLLIVIVTLMMPDIWPNSGWRRVICRSNMSQLGLALLNYQERNGSFPPQCTLDKNSNPLMSWRTAILPSIEQPIISSRYHLDEPWNSPTNKPLSKRSINIFECSSDDWPLDHPGQTSYVAVIGPGTMWKIGQGVKRSDIKDRLFDTLLLVELKDSGIAWSEPRDLDLNNLPAGLTQQNLLQSLSNHAGGFNAVFADGHVEFIPSTIPWSQFIALTTIDGGETIDRSTW